MVKSIFELERRFDFDKEFKRLLDLLDQRIYNCEYRYFKPQNFWTIVNCYFTSWKYRLSAITAEQYLEDIDINFNYLYECNDEQKMYVLQFVDSYVFFLINNYKISRENIKDDNTYNPYITIIDNIGHIIKNLNFKRECDNQKEHITYIKSYQFTHTMKNNLYIFTKQTSSHLPPVNVSSALFSPFSRTYCPLNPSKVTIPLSSVHTSMSVHHSPRMISFNLR